MFTAARQSHWLVAMVIASAGIGGCGGGGSASNVAPVANAGPDVSAFKREVVTLDASLSIDAEGRALTYSWIQTTGPNVTLSSATAAKPTFAAPSTSTVLTFSLTVSDGSLTSIADTVTVSVVNRLPVASAGGDKNARTDSLVTLDGRSSSDPDGDTLTYAWKQLSGSPVTLDTATPGTAKFATPSSSQGLNFSLSVNDGEATSVTSNALVSVTPTGSSGTPLLSAGFDRTFPLGLLVNLNGTAVDPDGQIVTTTWKQLSGPTVTLSNVNSLRASFTTPNTAAVLVFEFSGTDGTFQGIPDTVTITVQNDAPNSAPILRADFDQTLPRNSLVHLNGVASDPEDQNVTTTWKQLSGPTVTLLNVNSLYASFTAPNTAAVLVFEFSGTDGIVQGIPDTITITIENFSPSVVIALPAVPKVKSPIVATVSATDPDKDPLTMTYSWTKNGVAIAGQSTTTLPVGNYVRGDQIGFTASANDGTTTTARSATVTIQDTLPVFTATPPASVNFGGLVSFHITSTDDDGDAIQYAIHHGPAGMQVNSAGDVSWTAKLPMFDTSIDVDWGIGITNSPIAILSGTLSVTDAARKPVLRRTGVELPQLHHGMVATDLDGDGHDELLIGSHRALYEYGRVGTGYGQRWVYPYSLGGSDITAVAAVDVAGDSKKEIFVATRQHVYQLDGTNRRISVEYMLAANSYCRDLVVADLTNDGSKELVCLSYSAVSNKSRAVVFSAQTGAIIFQTPEFDTYSLYELEVGNVDTDAAKEIVLNNGYVYDGDTFANEWVATNPFGSWLSLGDVDGDGIAEIIAYSDLTRIAAWDVVHRSIRWQPTLGDDYTWVTSVSATDLDGDGTAEILASGAGGYRSISAYHRNSSTGATEVVFDDTALSADTPIGFAVADLDQSGAKELIVNAGSPVSSSPALFGVNIHSRPLTTYWRVDLKQEPTTEISGGQLAQVAVGQSRLVFGGKPPNSDYHRIYTLDAATSVVDVPAAISGHVYRMPMDIVDYDNDGVDEALVSFPPNGAFVAVDILTNNNEWTSPVGNDYSVFAIGHGDLNGDNHAELVGLSGDGYIVVYDISNQTLLWKSDQINALTIAVIDVDGDGLKEIVALSSSKLYIFEKSFAPFVFRERKSIALSIDYARDLLVADTDGDGKPEIFVVPFAGAIYKYNNLLVQLATLNVQAQAVFLEDLGSGKKNILIAVSENIADNNSVSSLRAVDPNNGTTVWKSPVLSGNIAPRGLFYVDTNGDGEREISFSSSTGMHVTR